MDHLVSKFSQKTQIKYMKLGIIVWEDQKFTEEELNDLQIYQTFVLCKKDDKKALKMIQKQIEWQRSNKPLLKEIEDF